MGFRLFSVTHIVIYSGFFLSIADAQKKIKAGGLYLNNARITDTRHTIQESDLIDGKVCVLRVGKSSYYMIQVV